MSQPVEHAYATYTACLEHAKLLGGWATPFVTEKYLVCNSSEIAIGNRNKNSHIAKTLSSLQNTLIYAPSQIFRRVIFVCAEAKLLSDNSSARPVAVSVLIEYIDYVI